MEEELLESIHKYAGKHWWFRGRQRIVLSLLDRFCKRTDAEVLDLGCGPGNNLSALSRFGPVSGADMISQAGQFSSNVTGNSYVQGVLLGGEGNRGVAHTIDVELTGAGRIKDVGLLREIN